MLKNTLIFFAFLGIIPVLSAQEIPLTYSQENSGSNCAAPILKTYEALEIVRPLPDPFEWSDGSGRIQGFSDWECRRNEIAAEIQKYEIGEKPGKPEKISASFIDDTLLTVTIEVNGETLELKSKVVLPDGDGPFPAVIGIGRPSGSLSPEIFSERNIAMIAFDFRQVMSHTQTRGKEPINRLYPELTYIGSYSAWSWGVSRLIDGLELVQEDLPIDLKHIAITGCSFAGKMALFAGAFDERIALTIAQESGGGGAAAWRVSETLGNVETLAKTNFSWFIEEMIQFGNSGVSRLPHDHHELMAMIAPRALLVLGNPDYEWLADESGYVSCRAAHEVWKEFGIGDRFGFSIIAGHPHCRLPDSQLPEVTGFIDKFLLGEETADTDYQIHPFEHTDHKKWYEWWGTGAPDFPEMDTSNVEFHFYEAECGTVGNQWIVKTDNEDSTLKYVTISEGLNITDNGSADPAGLLSISINVQKDTTFHIFGKVNCEGADNDSFWVKIDNQDFVNANGLGTKGWAWVSLMKTFLEAGEHTITISYREDGAKLDQIAVTSYMYGPEGKAKDAENKCE